MRAFGRSLIVLAACGAATVAPVAAVAAVPASSYAAGSFPLDVKEVDATLDLISGRNTAHARMTGRVRKGDAKEYCGRDPDGATTRYGGTETKAQCAADQLKQEAGKRYAASADCVKNTITSTIGRFTYAGGWKGEDGQVLDGSNASGAPTVDAQFTVLCPASAKALKIGASA